MGGHRSYLNKNDTNADESKYESEQKKTKNLEIKWPSLLPLKVLRNVVVHGLFDMIINENIVAIPAIPASIPNKCINKPDINPITMAPTKSVRIFMEVCIQCGTS